MKKTINNTDSVFYKPNVKPNGKEGSLKQLCKQIDDWNALPRWVQMIPEVKSHFAEEMLEEELVEGLEENVINVEDWERLDDFGIRLTIREEI